jgi:hypothetical protein
LVVVVIVEHGGDGGSIAGPIAGKVIEAFLGRRTQSIAVSTPPPSDQPASAVSG